MKKTIITCDRCGSIIENSFMPKITIAKPIDETYHDIFGKEHKKRTYKTIRIVHICADCRQAFDDFLDGTI